MDNNLLQGIGIFVCVGAILLVVLAVIAVRALTRNRNQEQPTMWNKRGDETPRYDNPDVESRGGFGGVPQTGRGAEVFDRDDEQRGPRKAGDFGGTQPQRPTRRRDKADDDDIRSSGGFGGG